MKRLKRVFAFLLTGMLLLSDIPVSVSADTTNKYTALMETSVSKYMLTCQPDSALVLNSTVELTENDLSPNYFGGVVDLPRLSVDYYYSVNTSTGFYLGSTMYPTLCWTDSSFGNSVTLNIKTHATKKTVATVTIVNTNNLPGTDYYYPKYDNAVTGVPARTFEDCSANVVTTLVNAGSNMRYYESEIELYDATLHKNSIVMPTYIYTTDDSNDLLTAYEYNYASFTDLSYLFYRKEISGASNTTSYNIKDYIETLDSTSGLRTGLLFGGSKIEDCTYDPNTGECKTVVKSTDTDTLYSFIALNSRCYFYELSTATVNTDMYSEVDPEAPTATWEAENYYSLISGSSQTASGFDEEIPEGYLDYGPVSYDTFWKYAVTKPYQVTNRTNGYWFCHYNESDVNGMNVFAESLIYDGCIPHVATVNLKAIPKSLTVNFYYVNPEESSSKLKLLDTVKYYPDDTGTELPTLPKQEFYTEDCWYTDSAMRTAFSWDNVLWEQNGEINLYGKYKYTGGTYTVTYYNDNTGAKTTEEYRIIEQPTLPSNPKPAGGYGFKAWQIVDDYNALAGPTYDPETFEPEKDKNYIFKTSWDVKGIIVKVLTTKMTYFVGEEVDKNLLEVVVQSSNDVNDTRRLDASEYTISDSKITKEGKNQFTITYTATGATATCEINGVAVELVGIEAKYNGGDVIVGTSLKPEQFVVKLKYNNDTSDQTTDFTISPKTVTKLGANTIRVTYGTHYVDVNVNGIEQPKEEKVLKSLSATYVGNKLYVNQTMQASDLLVVATYSDNTTETLGVNAYKFSPSKFSVPGKQNITVTYDGMSTSCEVTIYEDTSDDTSDETEEIITPTPSEDDGDKNDDSEKDNSDKDNSDKDTSNKNDDDNQSTQSGGDVTIEINGDDDNNDSDSNGKGTSPGYLSAANILTNVMSTSTSTNPYRVDILERIRETGADAMSVDIILVNGANGNTVTKEALQLLKDRKLTLNITMVKPSDQMTVLAQWTVYGATLLDTNVNFNPNITFEVTDKETDRILYFATASPEFTNGYELTVYPAIETYGSGELIRLYACDTSKVNSEMLQAFAWQDGTNAITVDLYTNTRYALSNALDPYDVGISLLNNQSNDMSVTEDEEYTEDFDWDDIPSEEPQKSTEIPTWLFLGAGVILVIIAIAAITLMLLNKRKRVSYVDDASNEDGNTYAYDTEEEVVSYNLDFDEDDTVE